jgi:O-antigen ligase
MTSAPHAALSDAAILLRGTGILLIFALITAVFLPPLFWWLLAGAVVAGMLLLAFRFTEAFTVAWLLVAGATLEMTLADLLGESWFQPTIAAVKANGLGLAAIAALRWGARLDAFNPAWAWCAMFLGGWVHGLYPGLTIDESLRSLTGSVAPFAFGFARVSRRWADAVIRATPWIPLCCVAAGAVLDLAGVRPLFIDSAGLRLAGLGHPAFLAGVAQTAAYASLLALFRRGRYADLILLGTNFLILLLTGARAPLSYALAVAGLATLLVRSPAFPARHRLLLVLSAAAALPLAVLLLGATGADVSAVRAFNVLEIGVGNLSGRQILWPNFEHAAAQSPWLGWGVGAGNVIIPQGGEVARLLRTWAAHNEYLRVAAEGGELGRALLVLMFVLWVARHTSKLPHVDKVIMRLVFIAFAGHAFTDNLLISTPACVLFTFAIAVFARGEWEARANRRLPGSPAEA